MTKILLLIPTYYSNYEQTDVYFPTAPLGIGYIASCLEKAGHEVKIFDTLGRNETIKKTIIDFKPDVIAVQCFTTGFSEFKRVIYEIRTYYSGLLVVGGAHITAMKDDEMPDFPIDYFIRKEAEITMVKLADGWRPENKIIDGEVTNDLDSLPLPARHLMDLNLYSNEKRASIISSRGCPYKCTFCFDSHQWRNVRLRKPDAVVEEMKLMREIYGFDKFFFTDDTFILNENRTKEFADLLEGKGFIVSANARCNTVNEEIAKDMTRMGMDNVYVGVESYNQRLLNIIKKGITKEQIINTHEILKKHKLSISSFMLMSLPTQTIPEMYEDLKFSLSLIKKYNAVVDYSILYLYPNTPVYYEAKEKNPIYDIKDWSTFKHKWRYPNVPIYVEQGHNLKQMISLYKEFIMKINIAQTPKHKLPLVALKYIARNSYRKLMPKISKNFVSNKR